MKAVDAVQLLQKRHQHGSAVPVHPVARGVLGDDGQLRHAPVGQTLRLVHQLLHGLRHQVPPDEGDGAVGAAVVAPVAGPQKRPVGGRGQDPVRESAAKLGQGSAQLLGQEPRQLLILPDSQQDVDLRQLFRQLLPIPLREAARGHQHPTAAPLLVLGHLQDGVDALLLGRVDEAAGVHDQHLRLLGVGGELIAGPPQQAQHPLRVHLVLGTAKADDAYVHTFSSSSLSQGASSSMASSDAASSPSGT